MAEDNRFCYLAFAKLSQDKNQQNKQTNKQQQQQQNPTTTRIADTHIKITCFKRDHGVGPDSVFQTDKTDLLSPKTNHNNVNKTLTLETRFLSAKEN